jgi:endoglucanase
MNYLLLLILISISTPLVASEKLGFWEHPRAGANSFNKVPLKARYEKATASGLRWLRIAPNKWLGKRTKDKRGDFLIGPKGQEYQGLIKGDLKLLKTALDNAHASNLKIVLTMLSLPGNRWSQHNAGKQERKIWTDFKYHDQSAKFWKDLASQLKDHPAVVAYNIKNEPCPERSGSRFKDWYSGDYEKWYQTVKGTPQDLNLFYRKVVKAIRSVDSNTPIMIDSSFYATPWSFKVLEPIDDKSILYAFHMYEPYALVNRKNKDVHKYPGIIPTGETDAKNRKWNKISMSEFLEPIRSFQKKYDIPSNRIVAAEFGIPRKKVSALAYLRDQIEIYQKEGWHWAFYSFREDDWDAMDYELGTKPAGMKYWEAVENGKLPPDSVYARKSKIWEMLKYKISGNQKR